ncbi:MAG TPA: phage tail terminator-like protein [Azospirillum sp.]
MSLSEDIRGAARAALTALVRATTGPLTTLSVTAAGYRRAAGSFLADGFVPGDEVRVSGCPQPANNGTAVLTAVTDSDLTVLPRVLLPAAAGPPVTITAGLPEHRAWEAVAFTRPAERAWVRETLIPLTPRVAAFGRAGHPQEHVEALLQIDLFVPTAFQRFAPGTLHIERLGDAIRDALAPGVVLAHGAHTIHAAHAARLRLMPDGDWVHCPIEAKLWTRHTRA